MRTDEIPPEERAVVEEHLQNCPSCEESVHDIEGLASLARELRSVPPRSCAAAVCDAVRENFGWFEFDGRRIFVVFSSRGIRAITTGDWTEDEFRARMGTRFGELELAEIPAAVREPIERALRGEEPGDVALDLSDLTEFERAVLDKLRTIPRGEVRPYRWLAAEIGKPAAVRAVGNVMARNPIPLILPCHRVVPNGGGVGNYGWGPAMKRSLLRDEGVPVDELDRLARQHVRYVGSKTTNIYCFPTCRHAKRIKDENRVPIHDEAEAAAKGFRPCLVCRPLSKAS
ncbi:MAG TPA: methylated-DNA--[protein]-cysteine S-methyltransferase [Thermoanaerobaculia bacterium]|nr:methylated-DNA--[protein]-cysteine S-methyltransferase [Thermoanaerobaculia bacterium]